jgi:hypothetical protein
MLVEQVIALAKEWVQVHGSSIPGFCGAHLMGGLNDMPKDAPFPAYRDVDLNILVQSEAAGEVHDVSFRGLILEYGVQSAARYASAEQVLADPELASNLVVNSILADPLGILGRLHVAVAQQYARRDWVLARCAAERAATGESLEAMRQAGSTFETMVHLAGVIFGLSGLLATATLTPPTHRRSLVVIQQLLARHGRAELHEELLAALGFAHMSHASVAGYLSDSAEAFDRAVQVHRTPVIFDFKLRPHVRPYVVDGAQEMIDAGCPREAMFWIWSFILIANGAIQADAPEPDRRYFQAKADRLLDDMGWLDPAGRSARVEHVARVAGALVAVADDIVS